MTIIRTIICNRCGASYTEIAHGAGFPNWGKVVGLVDTETGEETAHVCPECKESVASMLNDGGGS